MTNPINPVIFSLSGRNVKVDGLKRFATINADRPTRISKAVLDALKQGQSVALKRAGEDGMRQVTIVRGIENLPEQTQDKVRRLMAMA